MACPLARVVGRRDSLITDSSDFFCSSFSRFCFFIISANENAKSRLWFSNTVGSSGFFSGGRVGFLTTVMGLCGPSFFAADWSAGFSGAGFAAGFFAAGLVLAGTADFAAGFFATGFSASFATVFFAAGFAAGFFGLVLIRFFLWK